ncbi:hypothetical protein [Vibrio europaeus]|uniref:hypothetical protein n=1 Tax=Vibrio europaeus TaxID=300876 RepID=UPI00233E9210|nr:hypothetical protein [Vibrio europaeus]MDC5855555.1 hypothetical protein [Vibrio europaeus]
MKLRTILAANMLLLAANANAIDFSCGGTCDQTILCEVLSDVKAEEISVSVKGNSENEIASGKLNDYFEFEFPKPQTGYQVQLLKNGQIVETIVSADIDVPCKCKCPPKDD